MKDWSDRAGLWRTDIDKEGGSILVGKGSAVRWLPSPPPEHAGFGFRSGVDLQQAPDVAGIAQQARFDKVVV